MKKIIRQAFFLLLLTTMPAMAQNMATTDGPWDDCATWGNPASIFNVVSDTKTINPGADVTMNVAWSTGNVDFGTGNGSVSFADNTKYIDFVVDAGGDKSCVAPAVSGITCSSGVLTGSLSSQTSASSVSKTVPYTGGNGAAYSAGIGIPSTGVTGLTATLRAGTLTASTGNLIYDITGTPGTSGTASFAISFAGRTCTMTITVSPSVLFDTNGISNCNLVSGGGWILSGTWKSAATCDPGVQPACYLSGDACNNSTVGTGMAYKTVATTIGTTYTVYVACYHNGFGGFDAYGVHTQTRINIYDGTATSGTTLRSYLTNNASNHNTTWSFTFVATGTTTTFRMTEEGTTSAGDQQVVASFRVTY